jgi:hypothetical protein
MKQDLSCPGLKEISSGVSWRRRPNASRRSEVTGMIRLPLPPFEAYREDLASHAERDVLGPADGAWLVVAGFLDRVGTAPVDVRADLMRRYVRELSAALATTTADRSSSNPLARLATLCAALGSDPDAVDPDQVAEIVRAMTADMEASGALQLAYSTLCALGRAFPHMGHRQAALALLQRARVASALGELELARAL